MSELWGAIILILLLISIGATGGIVIYFTGHFMNSLREYNEVEESEISKKELRAYLLLFLVIVIMYGLINIGLIIAFTKVTNFFW